ncbi:MAG: hypothetical protein ABR562_09460, partial [Thermoplasmatota archaeon]
LKEAHDEWRKINGEDDWVKDGQGGTAGYQLVHIWLKALKDIGTDPTREKFRAALLTYENLLVRPGDLRRLDAAFFTMNGLISVAFFAFVLVDSL